jgi:LSD1 subclass zinc finger protein
MPEAAALRVDVLTCGQCGAPVPLGDGDELPCRHCQKRVAVPEAHRQLRDALREDVAAVAAAEKLYAQLSRPAPSWQRWLASTKLFAALTLVMFVAAFAALVLVAPKVDAWLSQRLGERLRDTWSMPNIALWHTGLLLVAASPWLLLVVGERRAAARAHLRAELAAAPPAFAGGERGCRSCGAPLVVPDGALGARCAYCRADNLVKGGDELQRRVAHRGGHVAAAVADARALAEWERVWLRRSLMLRVGVPCVFFLVAAGFDTLTWRAPAYQSFADYHFKHRQPRRSYEIESECRESLCVSQLLFTELALRKGERLRLRVVAIPDGDELARVAVRMKDIDSHDWLRWAILAESEVRAGEDLIAQAPYTGLYEWELEWRAKRAWNAKLPPSIVERVIENGAAP